MSTVRTGERDSPRPSIRFGRGAPEAATDTESVAKPSLSWHPGWAYLAISLASYAACLVVATYPRIHHLASSLPGYRVDSLQHIWVMKWYKSCLLSGRLPFVCPDLQYPVGASLGRFSPMLLQAALFIPLSILISNDVLCYNILWIMAFLFTGMSVLVLGWQVLGDRRAAWFGGLAAMLSTPMMMRAHGHLELMWVGSICLFLAAWIRWLDRPTRAGMVWSALLYLLAAFSAAYFTVFAVIPAVLFLVVEVWRRGRREGWSWLRARLRGLLGFNALVIAGLIVVFASQVWAVVDGTSLHRTRAEFDRYGSPVWSYLIPSTFHRMFAVFPLDSYGPLGYSCFNSCAYLGIVILVLLHYAAVRRVDFPQARFWWITLVVLVVLSLGSTWQIGAHRVPLPAGWLWKVFYPLRLTRGPARFNLLACCIAVVVAAAALRHGLNRIARRSFRISLLALLTAGVVLDLGMNPFGSESVPAIPRCYEFIRQRDPSATIVEIPLVSSGAPHPLTATCGYWQSIHGLATTAGYSGYTNSAFDDLIVYDSPFDFIGLLDPAALSHPEQGRFGIVHDVRVLDYVWMYTKYHKINYIIIHRWNDALPGVAPDLSPLQALMADAVIFEDAETVVYDQARLRPPTTAILLKTTGWQRRLDRPGPPVAATAREAGIIVHNPCPGQPLTVTLEARAFRQSRSVRLRAGERILAQWRISSEAFQTCASPPLILDEGTTLLTLESDADEVPTHHSEQVADGNRSPYSLLVSSLRLAASPKALASTSGGVAR